MPHLACLLARHRRYIRRHISRYAPANVPGGFHPPSSHTTRQAGPRQAICKSYLGVCGQRRFPHYIRPCKVFTAKSRVWVPETQSKGPPSPNMARQWPHISSIVALSRIPHHLPNALVLVKILYLQYVIPKVASAGATGISAAILNNNCATE